MTARLAALLLALMTLTGCLEQRETLHLFADGSGRYDRVTLEDPTARAALREALATLYALPPETAEAVHLLPLDPAAIRATASATGGYEIGLLETSEEEGRRRTVLQASFPALAVAARGGALLGADVRLARRRATAERDVAWRLEIREGWGRIGNRDRAELGGRSLDTVREHLRSHLADTRIERTLVLPTRVLATNGELGPDGVTVRWVFALTELLDEEERTHWVLFAHRDDLSLSPQREAWPARRVVRALIAAPPSEDPVRSQDKN